MKDDLILVVGPTAIGKTDLSIELAKNLNAEIISADSMQIYKHMDIGSAKVKKEEMNGIVHHLIDFQELDEEFTVSDYRDLAVDIISNLIKVKKQPIIVGGTGLYINSLTYDLNFTQVEANFEFRNKLENLAKNNGNEYLHCLLKKIDKESAKRIHKNDLKRVIRALEVYKYSGKTMTEYNKNFRKPSSIYNPIIIGLYMDRKKLYEKIDLRVDRMIENGLVEEVHNILKMGYDENLTSLQAIGYKELILYLKNEITLNDAIKLIKQKSRNYAKRQITWFRRDNRVKWFNKDLYKTSSDLTFDILKYIEKQKGL